MGGGELFACPLSFDILNRPARGRFSTAPPSSGLLFFPVRLLHGGLAIVTSLLSAIPSQSRSMRANRF